jgi:hypothetical protein
VELYIRIYEGYTKPKYYIKFSSALQNLNYTISIPNKLIKHRKPILYKQYKGRTTVFPYNEAPKELIDLFKLCITPELIVECAQNVLKADSDKEQTAFYRKMLNIIEEVQE